MKNLAGKRVLITGAEGGIAQALALILARERCELILSDITAPTTESTEHLRAAGAQTLSVPMDVTRADSIAAAREAILERGGPIDILVNNAGLVCGGAFLDVPIERHAQTYAVNLLGAVNAIHAFLPDLVTRPEAHIINIASASGFVGLPFGASYASSKWGVIGLSESLRLELRQLGRRHVGVTTVCPSYVDTGMFEGVRPPLLTPLLTPERLAELIVAALRRNRPFVKAPWTVHLVTLARGLFPTWAFDRFTGAFGVNTSMQQWHGRPLPAPRRPGDAG